jgi:hypothetical protein
LLQYFGQAYMQNGFAYPERTHRKWPNEASLIHSSRFPQLTDQYHLLHTLIDETLRESLSVSGTSNYADTVQC